MYPEKTPDYFQSEGWQKVLVDRKARLATLSLTQPDTLTNDDQETVGISKHFMKSMIRLKCHSSKKGREVGMLVRFDNDDTTTETFWSEHCFFLDPNINQLGYERQPVKQLASNGNGYKVNKKQPAWAVTVKKWLYAHGMQSPQPNRYDRHCPDQQPLPGQISAF